MANGNFMDTDPALILLSGLPGAGKTTFAERLKAVIAFCHIESDAIRLAIAPEPTFTFEESGRVFARVEAEARAALQSGRHALIDATNLTRRDRKRFLRLVQTLGVRLVAVRVVAPEATIRERLSAPRTGNSKAGWQVYERMSNRPQPFDCPTVVVDTRFDTTPAVALVRALAVNQVDG
ncbi:MAG: AAA family ATPase [Dehalococcoidia bacterium]